MSLLTEFSKTITQGTYINFTDAGYLNPKSQTKRFVVSEKGGSGVLGEVRWFSPWRKYCFYANNIILEETCMAEIIEFIKAKTAEHKAKWK